jgi:hypothetical protein
VGVAGIEEDAGLGSPQELASPPPPPPPSPLPLPPPAPLGLDDGDVGGVAGWVAPAAPASGSLATPPAPALAANGGCDVTEEICRSATSSIGSVSTTSLHRMKYERTISMCATRSRSFPTTTVRQTAGLIEQLTVRHTASHRVTSRHTTSHHITTRRHTAVHNQQFRDPLSLASMLETECQRKWRGAI